MVVALILIGALVVLCFATAFLVGWLERSPGPPPPKSGNRKN